MIGEIIINAFLVTLMLTIAVFIINTRKVISTILLAGTYSLVAALMLLMTASGAHDVERILRKY